MYLASGGDDYVTSPRKVTDVSSLYFASVLIMAKVFSVAALQMLVFGGLIAVKMVLVIATASFPMVARNIRLACARQRLRVKNGLFSFLRNKIQELEAFLVDSAISIVCLTEHHLSKSEIDTCCIQGFKIVSSFVRHKFGKGGSLIFAKNSINTQAVEKVNAMSIEKQCEVSCCYFSDYNFYVLSVYRSPSIVLSESEDHSAFQKVLERALNCLPNKNIIIAGDFNIKFGTNDKYCSSILDFLSTYGLQQMITSNTRNNNCIDNIFVNFSIDTCEASVETKFCTDHLGQKIKFVPPVLSPTRSSKKVCRPITESGKLVFFHLVEKLNWSFIQDTKLGCDKKFETFIDIIQNCLYEAFPEKTLLSKTDRSYEASWFNDDIRKMREQLYFLNSLYSQNQTDYLKNSLNAFKKKYRIAIISAKKSYNEQIIKRSNNPTKCMWEIINKTKKSNHKRLKNISINPDELLYGILWFVPVAILSNLYVIWTGSYIILLFVAILKKALVVMMFYIPILLWRIKSECQRKSWLGWLLE
nr:unnamed protein product [Callosobruchus analis]